MTIEEVVDRLKEGNVRFVEDRLENTSANQSRRDSLLAGQAPYAIVLGCADSTPKLRSRNCCHCRR